MGEINETDRPTEVSKPEMDSELSSELDETYQSYLENGQKQEVEEEEDPEAGKLTETDRAKLKEETGWSDEVEIGRAHV